MRHWMTLIESALGHNDRLLLAETVDLHKMFRATAWDLFLGNVGQNELELEDYISDYEDDTDEQVRYPKGRRNERNVELEDPAFKAWLSEMVFEKADNLANAFAELIHNNSIHAWRAITAPETWKPKPGAFLGSHWTRTKEQAIAHFGGGRKHIVHVIEADIPLQSIDWDATLRANLSEEFGEEDEITIKDGAAVTVTACYINR